jgi:hypothetical protein
MSSLVHPASWSASARIGIAPKSRLSYTAGARATAVEVRQAESNETGRNGLPKMSRMMWQ